MLLQGTLLTADRRTITVALRAMGLSDEPQFSKYHHVFNRAKWSPWVLSKLLLALLIKTGVPPGAALVLLIDDTLERRRGPQIKYKGWFRDPIRSTVKHVSTSLGIRWLCVALVVFSKVWNLGASKISKRLKNRRLYALEDLID